MSNAGQPISKSIPGINLSWRAALALRSVPSTNKSLHKLNNATLNDPWWHSQKKTPILGSLKMMGSKTLFRCPSFLSHGNLKKEVSKYFPRMAKEFGLSAILLLRKRTLLKQRSSLIHFYGPRTECSSHFRAKEGTEVATTERRQWHNRSAEIFRRPELENCPDWNIYATPLVLVGFRHGKIFYLLDDKQFL